jgi:hypothetical protein
VRTKGCLINTTAVVSVLQMRFAGQEAKTHAQNQTINLERVKLGVVVGMMRSVVYQTGQLELGFTITISGANT